MTKKVIIVPGLLILILIIGFVAWKERKALKESEFPTGQEQEKGEIFFAEKQQIEAWIKENNLNQYGDPQDTVYMGGTPLFNEKTGESLDRYEYILRKHPDRPWLK